jgi:hypothetical protein
MPEIAVAVQERQISPRSLTLREIDEELLALVDSVDACATEEDQVACLLAIERYAEAKAAKVDGTASIILLCEDHQATAEKEVKRWTGRKRFYANIAERLGNSVLRVMRSSEKKRFDGDRYSFVAASKPASVSTRDEGLIPIRYKTIILAMRGEHWQRVIELVRAHDGEFAKELLATIKTDWDIRKTEISEAIKSDKTGNATFDSLWASAGTNAEKIGTLLLSLYRQLSSTAAPELQEELSELMVRIANWKLGGSYVTARTLAFDMFRRLHDLPSQELKAPVPGADLAIGNQRLDIK